VETGSVFQSFRKGGSVKPDRFSEGSVADIVKRYAKAAGLDPEAISGHSLRAGFVTSALEAGADLLKVMDVTRHREVTLKAYDRRAKAFKNHAGKGFL
jgi:site-specific recombinase XerD